MMKLRMIGATIMLTAGCSTLDAKPAYLHGPWGGPHAGIVFQGSLADVRFDCAGGSIDALILPAKDGSFEAKGTYRTGSGGPIRVGQIFVSKPATYSGNVAKDIMTLKVELDDGTTVGPFTLTQGAPPQLTRCL